MSRFVIIIRAWIVGACCAGAALLSGSALFVQGGDESRAWLDAVFLLSIFMGTVTVVRWMAKEAIGSMERGLRRGSP